MTTLSSFADIIDSLTPGDVTSGHEEPDVGSILE
ncbi:hypothetical protein MY10362_009736, partial [Beauveria mimosiformis]